MYKNRHGKHKKKSLRASRTPPIIAEQWRDGSLWYRVQLRLTMSVHSRSSNGNTLLRRLIKEFEGIFRIRPTEILCIL